VVFGSFGFAGEFAADKNNLILQNIAKAAAHGS
jgi:hypothetical protein